MLYDKFFWNLFERVGSIDVYLAYKYTQNVSQPIFDDSDVIGLSREVK